MTMKRAPLFLTTTGLVLAAGALVLRAHHDAPDEPVRTWAAADAAPEQRTPWEDESTADVLRDAGRLDSWRLWAKVTTAGIDAGTRGARERARATIETQYLPIVRKCYAAEGKIGGHFRVVFNVEPTGVVKSLEFSPAFSTHLRTPPCLSAVPRIVFPAADYAMRVTFFMSFDPRGGP